METVKQINGTPRLGSGVEVLFKHRYAADRTCEGCGGVVEKGCTRCSACVLRNYLDVADRGNRWGIVSAVLIVLAALITLAIEAYT